MQRIIFLDIDGVLNCQVFFEKRVKSTPIDKADFYKSQLCTERIEWLNSLCSKNDAVVVISSTWRKNKTVEQLQEILNNSGATFKIIGKTGQNDTRIRGVEIAQYLWSLPTKYEYVIIDDDSDMLLQQQHNFFQTDCYAGLTPNICHQINLFFDNKTN